MLLVLDIGNTETTAGLFDGSKLLAHWRLVTDVSRTSTSASRRRSASCTRTTAS
jgi:pantothenate kinase type III